MTTDNPQSQIEYDAPFAKLLDMRPGLSADGVGTATMTVQDKHRQAAGVVQGGIIVTLADYAFFRAVRSVLQPGQGAVTVELKLNFIAPARDGEITATARIVSNGRRIIVGDMEVTGDNQTLIARGLGTYIVIQQPS
ncbi:MAG: hypothetical protein BZY88_12465 [SAR202 cluster bacterium Io17-Chloro-G9]|nr:MAG: hypothetical protein BZY88_12465 [SAR202 cluster bacterium Io17-Chloro-G9]